MKKYSILLAGLFFAMNLQAQPASRQARYYEAYQRNDLEQLKSVIREMETEAPEATLAIAKAKYGAVGACLARQDEAAAKQLLDEAARHTRKLLKENAGAEAHALYAGILGMKIALSPAKGPFLGGQAGKHAARALELEPDNPFVRMHHSNNLFYTPPAFGGDLQKAVEGFRMACQGFEAQGTGDNWPYLQCLAMLGQALQADGQIDAARSAYRKALAAAPEFSWVKNQLLPALE
ncbi:MAG: hypothetical protein KDD10_25985 [Phaeodactylibacter sp.]|nr:hypothetical protein [Phaeodactylibacter sp.]